MKYSIERHDTNAAIPYFILANFDSLEKAKDALKDLAYKEGRRVNIKDENGKLIASAIVTYECIEF